MSLLHEAIVAEKYGLRLTIDQLGKAFTGIERERKYFDIACERIARAQAQGQMFAPESAALPTQQAMEL